MARALLPTYGRVPFVTRSDRARQIVSYDFPLKQSGNYGCIRLRPQTSTVGALVIGRRKNGHRQTEGCRMLSTFRQPPNNLEGLKTNQMASTNNRIAEKKMEVMIRKNVRKQKRLAAGRTLAQKWTSKQRRAEQFAGPRQT